MRTKPITYNRSPPVEPIGIYAGIARRKGARLLHELLEVVPPSPLLAPVGAELRSISPGVKC
jgi:hypothetical protein